MSDSIKVAIKVRPLIKRERDDNSVIQWTVQENSIVSTDPEMKRRGDGGFRFDHIFDMNASNSDVFETVVKPIISAAVNGINGTVFAYGQTSSGKTYTMMGNAEEPGVVPLAIGYIFDAIANTIGREFLLRVSYLEIYNEKVNDLLDKSGTDLKLKEDGSGQVILQCKEEITNCPHNVLSIMKKGDKNRRIGETNMNERSSRSHTIFRITIESREAGGDSDGAVQVSQLNLVDLAGSERARLTGATGERFKEGRHINLSLSTLGLVIMQLSESQDTQKHVNFRDSKLTRLLQNSLGGNAMTAIICAITPAALEETHCTLSFASRAKSVKNKPQINEVMSDATLLKRYAKQLSKLQQELERIKNENRAAEVEEMESKLQEKDRLNQLLEERIELLKTRILSGVNNSQEEPIKAKFKRRQTWGGRVMSNLLQPTFQSTTSLATIKEVSFEKPQRKSIIQPMDIMNQTFQTAFTDFELELFESERNRDDISDSDEESLVTRRKNRVTFANDVCTIKSRDSTCNVTPVKDSASTQTVGTQHQTSPSTPKHVLRRCIMDLTKDFIELREFTTLEKQLICKENHCYEHGKKEQDVQTSLENIKSTPEYYKKEYTGGVKELLEKFNLIEEKDMDRIITHLCTKFSEIEKQNISEKEANSKLMKRFSDLEKQVENITSERNEFEHISCELRGELNKKIAELELNHMTEETIRKDEMKKITELEMQIENITSEKSEFERINADLHTKSAKRIMELEKQIENVTSERDEFAYMHRELRMELNKKSMEVEKLQNNLESTDTEMVNQRITELETEVKNVTSEKNKFEQINDELRTELNRITTEFEKLIEQMASDKNEHERVNTELRTELNKKIVDITSEKTELERMNTELNKNAAELKSTIESQESAYQEALEKICDLEKELKNIISEKNEFEHANTELSTQFDQRTCEFEAKVMTQQIENEKAMQTIVQLENQSATMVAEKDKLKNINSELHTKLKQRTSALKAQISSEKVGDQKMMEIINELEVEFESITSTNEELKCIITDLQTELNQKISALRSEEIEKQKAMEEVSELSRQIEHITSERNEFEHLNNRLNAELTKKTSESELTIMSEQTANPESIKKVDELQNQIENISLDKSGLEPPEELHCTSDKIDSDLKNDYINENNNLKGHIKELQDIVTNLRAENQNLRDTLGNQSVQFSPEVNESIANASYVTLNMDAEKSQLEESLHLKNQELEDIKSDVTSLKTDIKNLQETIYLLTTENMEMATKLTTEQEKTKQTELNFQETIDELYARISAVTNEKIRLEIDLTALSEELESVRSKILPIRNEEQLFTSYQTKIDQLKAENIKLSISITEKNKELESIKESKSLLYDHECIHKEKLAALKKQNKSLLGENNELSTDLIDKIEENDMLKEQYDILKSKIEQSLTTNVAENDLEHLKMENNILKTEITELKAKIAILYEENAKFSTNLLQTMEDLDSSRSEKSCNNSLHLSMIFDNVTNDNETKQQISEEETCETLVKKVRTLQDQIVHLTHLNKKLSDLKLTSCSQCEHLRNLDESRRALKLETKLLNQKLEDLQKKYDRKCADTENLKSKIQQESNVGEHDVSQNVSFVNETNVSFVEEKIQSLNDLLQSLKVDQETLPALYEDKCDQLEKLQSETIVESIDSTSDIATDTNLKRNRSRIEQIQSNIDQLKKEMDDMKKNSINFTATLNEFKIEKANLLNEINNLKCANEELNQKMLINESTATKKVQILENELTNMSKEMELFSTREKELNSQRLMLEVELEDLKVKGQSKDALITQLSEDVSTLKNELDLVTKEKNDLINSNIMECKEKELLNLKKQCEELENERVQIKELEQHNILNIRKLEAYINDLQVSITNQESVCRELQEKTVYLESLVEEKEQERYILAQKLQETEAELIDFKNNSELKYRNEFDLMVQEHQQHIKEYENNFEKLNDTLNKYIDENLNLSKELASLRIIKEKFNETVAESERVSDQQKALISENERLSDELNDIKKCMIKELKSLKFNVNSTDFSSKSVNEIFIVLLQTLVSKEEEIIQLVRESYEKEKRKVEDEKRQCIDTERRATMWAKELEVEIEKLQAELTERERIHKESQNNISQLEHYLRETKHENDIFKEKIETLEADLNNLQIEFDKQCKIDTKQDEAIIVAQRREKEAQEVYKSKEMELQSKFKSQSEMYEKKINNLVHTVESYKTKILELNSCIEGLEVNEKQMKNIIEANSIEIKRCNQNVEQIKSEFEQLTQTCNEMNQEVEEKNAYIKEITKILKDKCDALSEYKTELETIMPEYQLLKDHIKDHKSTIERCKEEIQALKKEKEEQLEIIKGKLNSEEIKNAGLSKQLNELNNKNVALIEELNGLKEKCEELQSVNAKLEKKIRNSTSKIKAEAEIEELKELNRQLQNNLEGASNRIMEFQEIKSKTSKDMVQLKNEYERALQENDELKKTFSEYKSKHSSSFIDESKYDALVLEKNKIALELEGKKIIINQKDKEIKEYVSQIQQLTDKNKELDDEVEEYAAIIREKDVEISKLEEKVYSRLTENTHINELEAKFGNLNEENVKLRDQVDALKMRLQMEIEKDVNSQNDRIMKDTCNRVKELEEEKNKIVKDLDVQKVLLNQKDKEIRDYIKKIRDLTEKNKQFNNELLNTAIIRDRTAEISNLEVISDSGPTENKRNNDVKKTLEFVAMENKKLKNEIKQLQIQLRIDMHNERCILKENVKKEDKNVTSEKLDQYEDRCEQLKKKIHELELQLVSKNGKIATLELQIQSENFPYKKRCKELEEVVLAFRNKNTELSSEIRKLQRTVNDVNSWECDICRRWRVNRNNQACQTMPNDAVRFRSINSGIVEDHVKIQKLEKEKTLMKDLCRSRHRQIRELQDRIKELEEVQSSSGARSNEAVQKHMSNK
ncbi:unnamed protein product [Xylocopa violacea]|uniref:Kinesin motor domain-containing protein n=1 Tax=Xylocopa violacea TaxID=135666 RepID=A0ABP1PJ04_XYLVO